MQMIKIMNEGMMSDVKILTDENEGNAAEKWCKCCDWIINVRKRVKLIQVKNHFHALNNFFQW
jgi:hypothetical protein